MYMVPSINQYNNILLVFSNRIFMPAPGIQASVKYFYYLKMKTQKNRLN